MELRVATLQMFTALRLLRAEWAGALVLGAGLGESGQALALAALGVGAAGVFLESDAGVLRAAQRSGCCTFVVTTLDEALRALKNEVRQGRAITVGLGGDSSWWIGEMVERGVLPAVVAGETAFDVSQFAGWGARLVDGFGLAGLGAGSVGLEVLLSEAVAGRWVMAEDVAGSMGERRVRDAALGADYVAEDAIANSMRLWLGVSPSLFARDRTRSRWIAAGGV